MARGFFFSLSTRTQARLETITEAASFLISFLSTFKVCSKSRGVYDMTEFYFSLMVGNGDCFPDELAKAGRKEMMKVLGQKRM